MSSMLSDRSRQDRTIPGVGQSVAAASPAAVCDGSHNSTSVRLEGSEPVYSTLLAHQQSQKDWRYHQVLLELHRWCNIFGNELGLAVPEIALSIGPARRSCYGYFQPRHNDLGIRREIRLNSGTLDLSVTSGEFWRALGTLLHELVHAWQAEYGRPGQRNYHNRQFQEKAATYGLIVDQRGFTQFVRPSRFFELLDTHGVVAPVLLEDATSDPHRRRGEAKLKKWICKCKPRPVIARVAIRDFQARCLICGASFRRSQ